MLLRSHEIHTVCWFAERRKMLKAGRVAAPEMERPAGEGAATFYSTEQSQSDKLNVEPGVTGFPHINYSQS